MRRLISLSRRAVLGAGLALPAGAALASVDAVSPEYGFAPGLTYLNTASLGPTPQLVRESMAQAWAELESNPVFEAYGDGPLHVRTDGARQAMASFLGCGADELLFTRSTTDAMNVLAAGIQLAAGDRVLTTDQEHEGATHCWTNLARRRGITLDVIPIAPEDQDTDAIFARFEQAMRPATKVISVSHVLSATGHRMPVERIAALARSHGALCVIDGAQALGQFAIDVRAIGCHAYAAPGHKWLMGPKGTGMLYLNPEAGDRVQLVQREAGPRFNTNATGVGCLPLAIGLGVAAEAMQRRDMASVETHNLALRNLAYEALARIPGLRMASAPPGSIGTAMVSAYLPANVTSRAFRDRLRTEHGLVVKMAEARWFNGFRLSPHVFNNEAQIERARWAIGRELGR